MCAMIARNAERLAELETQYLLRALSV